MKEYEVGEPDPSGKRKRFRVAVFMFPCRRMDAARGETRLVAAFSREFEDVFNGETRGLALDFKALR